jgi:AAA domain
LTATDQPTVGDVLYLALEDNPRRLQRRLTKYFGGLRETWPTRLKVVTEWKRLDQGGLDGIREWCGSAQFPVLIAIDTLKRVRPPKRSGQNEYDADYEACEGLQKLAGELGLSIIIAHHDRKMGADDVFDTVSGTLGLTGGVDAIALLKRNGQGVTLHIQGRDMEEEIEKAVRFDRETCRWSILGEAVEVHRSNARKAVLGVLTTAATGLTVKEIMAATGLDKRSAIDQLLYRMGKDGEIVRSARGRYALPKYALDALETSKKETL